MTNRTSQKKGKCLCFALLFIFAPAHAHADLNNILGHFQPYITIQEEYNSNIYLTPTGKKDDYITTLSPGLRFTTLRRAEATEQFRQPLETAEENFGIDLNFLTGFVFYAKQTSDNYVSLSGNLNGWYTWDRRLTFRLREYLIRSEEPGEQEFIAGALPGEFLLGTERGERAIYFRNVITPTMEYQFGREDRFSLSYTNTVYRNESPRFEDSIGHYVNPRLDYWFDIRNGILLEYSFTKADFEISPDLTGHLAKGRYKYRFNPRTSVFGDFTYFKRDFDFPGDPYDIYQPTLGIEHAFSPTLSASLQAGYFLQEPQRGSREDGVFYNVLFKQLAKRTTYTLAFQGGYTEDYLSAENLGFALYHRGIGTVTHRLLQRMTVGLSGSLEHADYVKAPEGRKDWIWRVWGDASYQLLRWLTLSLQGAYRKDNSNIDGFDYAEFRGLFQVTASY